MRPRRIACTILLVAVITGSIFAQDAPGQLSDGERRDSLKQATALFIITMIALIVMFGAMVALSILMRRRRQALEQQKPELPTELEDLWWKMNLPEDREKKE